MRKFEESAKSKKTVASMIIRKNDKYDNKIVTTVQGKKCNESVTELENNKITNDNEDSFEQNRLKLVAKMKTKKIKDSPRLDTLSLMLNY